MRPSVLCDWCGAKENASVLLECFNLPHCKKHRERIYVRIFEFESEQDTGTQSKNSGGRRGEEGERGTRHPRAEAMEYCGGGPLGGREAQAGRVTPKRRPPRTPRAQLNLNPNPHPHDHSRQQAGHVRCTRAPACRCVDSFKLIGEL
jgi:hypothetical protein